MPVPTRTFEQYRDPSEYFRLHDPETTISRSRERMRKAEALLGRVGVVLDVGCGQGHSLEGAVRAGWNAVGLEPSPDFAAVAEKISGAVVVGSTLSDAHFPDGSFDCVTLGAVLEHVYDPAAMLSEIRRILKADGLLYIGVPNERGLYFRMGNLYNRARGRDQVTNLSPTFEPFHVFGWSKRSLASALRSSSFSIISMRTSAMSSYYRKRRANATFEERMSEIVDLIGARLDSGSQMVAWARVV